MGRAGEVYVIIPLFTHFLNSSLLPTSLDSIFHSYNVGTCISLCLSNNENNAFFYLYLSYFHLCYQHHSISYSILNVGSSISVCISNTESNVCVTILLEYTCHSQTAIAIMWWNSLNIKKILYKYLKPFNSNINKWKRCCINMWNHSIQTSSYIFKLKDEIT